MKGELKEEDTIYVSFIEQYVKNLPDNVQKIWQYSFMEMMNNAIDHSQAGEVDLMIVQNYMTTTILIDDIGQGFAHEIFIVFQEQHNDVKLIPVNMNEDVEKMINHVKRS